MPTTSTPAYDRILSDYTTYHLVFLTIGGPLTLLLVVLAGFSWRRWKRAPRRTFERRTYLAFGIAGGGAGAFLALGIAANLSVVLNPRPGIAGVGAFSPAGRAWLESGRADLSPQLQHLIDERLAWQRPKAVVCAVLLVAVVVMSVRVWRSLIDDSRTGGFRPGPRHRLRLGAGVASAALSVLLGLMVIGNAEGAVAPLTLTMLFG